MSTFSDFQLAHPLNDVLSEIGYETPTPVQAKAIPLVLEGKDVLATAQTGTGKTAAFALPLLSKMLNGWRKQVLIVAPTRELAEQIAGVLVEFTKKTPQLRMAVVIGGSSYHRQIRSLRARPAFVIGTPGRLLDQVRLGHLNLKDFGALVIDEADRMLDMGFEPQMRELVAQLPADRQSLLFSATLPKEIVGLANAFLREPVRVEVGAVSKPVDKIRQTVIKTTVAAKDQLLIEEIDKVAGTIIVFVKTKWKTEKLAQFLSNAGHEVTRIHGDRTQQQRSNAIKEFREGQVRILVATDIAARGIDIAHIAHVVNYDLPMCAEDYIHRIGRTARAGAEGHSLAFVTPQETMLWARIHKLMYGKYPEDRPDRAFGRGGKRGFDRGFGHGAKNMSRPPRQFGQDRDDRSRDSRDFRRDDRGPARGIDQRSEFRSEKRNWRTAEDERPNRAARRAKQFGDRREGFEPRSPEQAPERAARPFRAREDKPRRQERPMGFSPRRENELRAEKFLKDESRVQRPGPKPLENRERPWRDRDDRQPRAERPQRFDRPQRDDRPKKSFDRPQRDDRPQRFDRPMRDERPQRGGYQARGGDQTKPAWKKPFPRKTEGSAKHRWMKDHAKDDSRARSF